MLGLAIAVGVAVLVGGGFVVASAVLPSNPADWALSATQVAQARQALMLTATETDPSIAASATGRAEGAWPSNITSGIAFGTDRGAANAAMGEPGAVNGAQREHRVVCAEAHGQFSTASLTHPAGGQVRRYSYAVICFDPDTGVVTDTGYDNRSVSGSFTDTVKLDVTSAIAHTVK